MMWPMLDIMLALDQKSQFYYIFSNLSQKFLWWIFMYYIVNRAYRIGQRRNVKVYRLISSGTIEENMYLRQIYKQVKLILIFWCLTREYMLNFYHQRNSNIYFISSQISSSNSFKLNIVNIFIHWIPILLVFVGTPNNVYVRRKVINNYYSHEFKCQWISHFSLYLNNWCLRKYGGLRMITRPIWKCLPWLNVWCVK
jgi:hypothetical protein